MMESGVSTFSVVGLLTKQEKANQPRKNFLFLNGSK